MGWNGSGGGAAPQKPKVTAKKPSPVRGLIAGLVVVLAAVVCYFAFFSESEKPAEKKVEKKTERIKEARVKEAREVEEKSPVPEPELSDREKLKRRGCFTNMYGYVYNAPSTAHVVTNNTANLPRTLSQRLFTNTADRKIGMLLEATPGQQVIGTLPDSYYGPNFVRKFLASFDEPIEISKDEPEHVQDLKRALMDTKMELKRLYDSGVDICQVLRDERKELQTIWLYREDLRKEVMKAAKNDELSKADVEDFVTAANALLDQRGAKHLQMPRVALRRFIAAEKAAAANGGKGTGEKEPKGPDYTQDIEIIDNTSSQNN